MRKKVNGDGDIWPRKAEALFYEHIDSASGKGREPNPQVEIVKCFDGGDVKKHAARAAAHTPEVRSGRSRVGEGWAFDNRTNNSTSLR
jgi:hypothetical protein